MILVQLPQGHPVLTSRNGTFRKSWLSVKSHYHIFHWALVSLDSRPPIAWQHLHLADVDNPNVVVTIFSFAHADRQVAQFGHSIFWGPHAGSC